MHVGKLHSDTRFDYKIAEFLLNGEVSVELIAPAQSVERPQIVIDVCRGIYQGVVNDVIVVGVVRIRHAKSYLAAFDIRQVIVDVGIVVKIAVAIVVSIA